MHYLDILVNSIGSAYVGYLIGSGLQKNHVRVASDKKHFCRQPGCRCVGIAPDCTCDH